MDRRFEQEIFGEQLGLPTDLLTNPGKYEADLPLWRRTVGFVRQYGHTRPNKREALVDQLTAPIANNPRSWKHLVDNLDLISELGWEGDIAEIRSEIFAHIESAAARRSNLSSWTPEKIEDLVSAGLSTSHGLNFLTQRVEAALFNAPRNIEESVDLHYNAAWAAVATMRSDVRNELISIICYEKDWFTELALPVFYFYFGGSGLTDDRHIKRFYAFQEARGALIKYSTIETDGKIALNPIRMQNLDRRLNVATQRWPFIGGRKVATWLFGLEKQYAVRFQRITQYYNNDPVQQYYEELRHGYISGKRTNLFEATEALLRMVEMKSHLTWPYDLKHDSNEPLRKMAFDFLAPQIGREVWERSEKAKGLSIITERSIQLTENFSLLMATQGDLSPEQKGELIRHVYSELQARYEDSQRITGDPNNKAIFQYANLFELGFSGVCAVDKRSVRYLISRMLSIERAGKLASIIENYRPVFTLAELKSVEARNNALRTDLQKRFIRSIGKRGYTLVVSDPFLRHLRYKEITFNQNYSNKVHVRMVIDKEVYTFELDGDYRIIPGGDIKRFVSAQDQAWLELITLSHLKGIICMEEDEGAIKTELVGGEKQYEGFRKQLISRREHLRRLTPGKNFSTEAFSKCLKSNFPVKNLYLINKMKAEIGQGGTKETGIWTYVSGTEYTDAPDAKPVKVALKNAAEDIRAAISLGTVSREELARVEEEILRELGI